MGDDTCAFVILRVQSTVVPIAGCTTSCSISMQFSSVAYTHATKLTSSCLHSGLVLTGSDACSVAVFKVWINTSNFQQNCWFTTQIWSIGTSNVTSEDFPIPAVTSPSQIHPPIPCCLAQTCWQTSCQTHVITVHAFIGEEDPSA